MNDLSLGAINHIKNYLDDKSVYKFDCCNIKIKTLAQKLFNRFTPYQTNCKLKNKSDIKSEIITIELHKKQYNNTFHKIIKLGIINNNIAIFIKELVKTGIFYVGGSFAVIYMHFLNNKPFDRSNYKDMDVDIYPISNISPNLIKSTLNDIIKQYINKKKIKCKIVIKNNVMNIYFEDILVQIILNIKQTIEKHITNIDLPITHFTIGFKKIYTTNLGLFAFNKGINIINTIYHKRTNNRIIKYYKRNYYTVLSLFNSYELADNERIVAFYDYDKYLLKYEIDILLSDLFKILKKGESLDDDVSLLQDELYENILLKDFFEELNQSLTIDLNINDTITLKDTLDNEIPCNAKGFIKDCIGFTKSITDEVSHDSSLEPDGRFIRSYYIHKTQKRFKYVIFTHLVIIMVMLNLIKCSKYTIELDETKYVSIREDYAINIYIDITRDVVEYKAEPRFHHRYFYRDYIQSYQFYKCRYNLYFINSETYPRFIPLGTKKFINLSTNIFFYEN